MIPEPSPIESERLTAIFVTIFRTKVHSFLTKFIIESLSPLIVRGRRLDSLIDLGAIQVIYLLTYLVCKGPFIATQLNSTRRRVELS